MQEPNQPLPNSTGRGPVRPVVAAMPLQRGNYGLPPRPVAVTRPASPTPLPSPVPQPITAPAASAPVTPTITPSLPSMTRPMPPSNSPQFMDVTPPTRPAFSPRTPISITPPPPAAPIAMPTQDIAPQAPVGVGAPLAAAQRPLFTPAPTQVPAQPSSRHLRERVLHPILHYGLIGIGVLLIVAGGIRFISAGNTSGDTVAVGAVSANDGRSMTIQFTATDGKLHKFSEASDRKLIPGSAVEIAYRSGAPEATARQVAVVKAARNLGLIIIMSGIASLAVAGVAAAVNRVRTRNKRRSKPLTTTVAV